MSDLYVRRGYCEEHSENDHWIDENFKCHGRSLAEVERQGYTWARHIGGGWFKLLPKYRPPTQAEITWQMAADARQQAQDNQSWNEEPDF
jgi:hypothetical protein